MKLTLQQWLEQADVESKKLQTSTWIPLMRSQTKKEAVSGFAGYRKEFISTECLIVPLRNREEFSNATWHSIQRNNPHWAWADKDRFIGPHEYEGNDGIPSAMYPVLRQEFDTGEPDIWHLLQEIELALGLLRKDDVWVRPSEDYIEVVKLKRDHDGRPDELLIRAEHLRDYLAARKAALLIGSFMLREAVEESLAQIGWPEGIHRREFTNGHWEGSRGPIHEGGMPWGESMAVLKLWRESVDPADDVPQMPHPAAETAFKSETFERKAVGRKLDHAEGCIWLTEWIEPAASSPRVGNDEVPSRIPFIVGNQGDPPLTGEDLKNYRGWIWFRTSVLRTLLSRDNVTFQWFSRDTGSIGPSPVTRVHFGINDHHLVVVAAKDIAELPEWTQRIWAAHNLPPEGGLSVELHASQNLATPARTVAPEKSLIKAIKTLQTTSEQVWGTGIFKGLDDPQMILRRVHRFHDESFEQTCLMAKEMSRNVVEKLDQDVINKQLSEGNLKQAKDEKYRSLKRLALLLDQLGFDGKELTRSLAGINDLRQGDAHPGSSSLADSLQLFGLPPSTSDHYAANLQIIESVASGLNAISKAIQPPSR